jgi:hypothetical protein
MRSVENTAEILRDLRGQLALVEVFADKGMLEDVLHDHAVVRVLLHDAQDEILGIVSHVNVLRELDFVFDLGDGSSTMRLRSSSE